MFIFCCNRNVKSNFFLPGTKKFSLLQKTEPLQTQKLCPHPVPCRNRTCTWSLGASFLPFFHCFSKFFSVHFGSKNPLKSRILSHVKVRKSLSLSTKVFRGRLASVSRNGESHELVDLNHKRVDGTISAWYDSQILVRIQFETIIIAVFFAYFLSLILEMITTFGLIYTNIIL